MLFCQFGLDCIEHPIHLPHSLIVAAQQLFSNVAKLFFDISQALCLPLSALYFIAESFLGSEESLILFDKAVTGVV